MSEGNRRPEDFDSDEELTSEEAEYIAKCVDAALSATDAALSKDAEGQAWMEEQHADAVAAQDAEHAGCWFLHEGCSLDPKVN